MQCPKSLKMAHEEVQRKIFVMLPEKWERLYLYASVVDHFSKVQTGEMFFFYYPKGVLKKRPINVYEVPTKYNIDEKQYFRLADDLYASIKNLREECIANKQKPWTNITISIEKQTYKAEYGYEELGFSEPEIEERHIFWSYKYLDMPYESFNKRERKIIDRCLLATKEPHTTFELPMYTRESGKNLDEISELDKKMTYVKEKKIEEMEYVRSHIPKSQILK